MSKLGPDYVGKLPPGAKEDLAASLKSFRKSAKDGIIRGIEISPGPGCSVAEAQAGTVYSVDDVPSLPLPGCKRSPCCGCDYLPVLK